MANTVKIQVTLSPELHHKLIRAMHQKSDAHNKVFVDSPARSISASEYMRDLLERHLEPDLHNKHFEYNAKLNEWYLVSYTANKGF